jgi:hypothetical protein
LGPTRQRQQSRSRQSSIAPSPVRNDLGNLATQNVTWAKEFKKRWPKAKGRVSKSALMEIIGRENGLKRRAAINAINRGLSAEWRLLPDGSWTDGTQTFRILIPRPGR